MSSTVALQSQIAFTTAPLFVRAPTTTATPNVNVSLVHSPSPYCRALRCSTNRNSAIVGRNRSGRTGSRSFRCLCGEYSMRACLLLSSVVNSNEKIDGGALSPELKTTLDKVVTSQKVVLFMKGTKEFPQCGFSNTVVQILKSLNMPFETINILENEVLRQGLKEYSSWPTFPQLYIDGEFFGGCDIAVGDLAAGDCRQTTHLTSCLFASPSSDPNIDCHNFTTPIPELKLPMETFSNSTPPTLNTYIPSSVIFWELTYHVTILLLPPTLWGSIAVASKILSPSSSTEILLQPWPLTENNLARSSPLPRKPFILDDTIGITKTDDA
nr:monothiol glutaredoxin-S7, chloroplastic [Ipomoea batatas]